MSVWSAHALGADLADDDLRRISDSLRTLDHAPGDPRARMELFEAARRLGLYAQAAPFQATDDSQGRRQIEGDLIALKIRYGIIDRDTLCGPRRFDRLDEAIAATDALDRQFVQGASPDGEDLRRLNDRIVALTERHHYAAAVSLYESMRQRRLEVPPWATVKVAESYLDQRKASIAAGLYRQVLAKNPDDFEAHVGLFYALSDRNDDASATRFIDAYAASLPERRHLDNKYNTERLSIDVLADRARINARFLDEAQDRLTGRLDHAPHNIEVLQAAAAMSLAREWPRSAQQLQQALVARTPCDANAYGELAETALQTQDWVLARQSLSRAQMLDQESPSVRRAATSMALHDGYELSVEVNYEHSPGGGSTASNYFGSDDWNENTFLYGPPLDERWRWFVHDYTAMADFSDAWTRWSRAGAGVEWRWLNWRVAAEANGGNVGGAGAALALRWALDDRWTFEARAASRSNDIPLKAVRDGIHANDVVADASWHLNESLVVSAQATESHFSDGNRRQALFVQWQQRWLSNARWQVDMLLSTSGSRNSLDQTVSYFNPRHDHDVMLTGVGEFITWRDYDYRFTQRLELGTGRYWESGYPSGNITYLRYAHAWQLGLPVEWHYGFAIVMRPYDGVREKQLRAEMGLLWQF
ncbi:poly-beta-1,6 N-acetyl-D-glucosamine export porin PgaA [Dyella soli]